MEKIEINRFDEIERMENVIEKLVVAPKMLRSIVSSLIDQQFKFISTMATQEEQITITLALISILYKENCYQKHIQKQLGVIDLERQIELKELEKIIYELKQNLEENQQEVYETIHKYGVEIEEYLRGYYCRKNANYIFQKYNLEIIRKQKKEKEFIKINPLSLNQLIYYNENPLTEEEKIIAQVIEYCVEAEQKYDERFEQLEYLKKLLKQNHTEEELDDIILFIIRDTYQEVYQDSKNPQKYDIMYSLENENIKPEYFIKYFKENEKFSNMFLENFIDYNLYIEEGRLEELKTKESYEKIKRLEKK